MNIRLIRRAAASALVFCMGSIQAAASSRQQTVAPAGQCYVRAERFGEPVDCLASVPTWIGEPDPGTGRPIEGPLSLDRMAQATAPILWFSPREFLLLEGRSAHAPGSILGTPLPTTYYRIREIWLRDSTGTTSLDSDDVRVRNVGHPWGTGANSLPLDRLDRVFIQYFFYYPEDRGVGGHQHDLEALEVQVEVRRVCRVKAEPSSGHLKGIPAEPCWPGVIVRTMSGSAHGVGWYTNTLDVGATRDTVVPLTVLVEENKHATVPDRDGDGHYMPHYDVNRHANDAWGVRDVTGSGSIGSPSYRAELSRDRLPDTQVCPKGIAPRLLKQFADDGRNRSGTDCISGKRSYELKLSTDSGICPPGEDLPPRLRGMMRDKHFCDPPAETRVVGPRSVGKRAVRAVLRRISPGPNGEYGFQKAVQRLSFSYRYDGGTGVSAIVPFGSEVPLVGGWAVLKLNAVFAEINGLAPPVKNGSIEFLYAPSASRAIDWYGSVGAEGVRPDRQNQRSWHGAGEVGLRFRFSAEKVRVIRFLGGRVGLRADLTAPIRNARLVYEFGAGSW
jgi:hypothetical protein